MTVQRYLIRRNFETSRFGTSIQIETERNLKIEVLESSINHQKRRTKGQVISGRHKNFDGLHMGEMSNQIEFRA